MDKIKGESLVEAGGFEPPTPCLQSSGNDENTGSLNQGQAHDGAQGSMEERRSKDAAEEIGLADTTFDTTAPRPWTPGPWKLFNDDTCFTGYIMRDGFRDYIFETAGGEEDGANARLIAAAPDLFEALDRLMGYVDSPCGGCGERNAPSEVFVQARAAMDKALGVDRG